MYTKEIKKANKLEKICVKIFFIASLVSLISVITITLFLFLNALPAILEVGISDFLFNTVWKPTATEPSFGIAYLILTSLVATIISLFFASIISVLVAVYIVYYSPKYISNFVTSAVELLAAIPSVVYGFMGLTLLVPFVMDVFNLNSGTNMLCAIILLTIMTLPTIISIVKNSLENLNSAYYESSLALGATHTETVFKVMLPAAKNGILTAIVLGASRTIGETSAIIMVSGNVVNAPGLFNSVRFLTSGIQFEMNYAEGLHREMLFAIGLVLFIFILFINLITKKIIKGSAKNG